MDVLAQLAHFNRHATNILLRLWSDCWQLCGPRELWPAAVVVNALHVVSEQVLVAELDVAPRAHNVLLRVQPRMRQKLLDAGELELALRRVRTGKDGLQTVRG